MPVVEESGWTASVEVCVLELRLLKLAVVLKNGGDCIEPALGY